MVKQADADAVSKNLRRFILFVIFLPRIGLELPGPFAATRQRPATEYSVLGRMRRRGGILSLGCNRCKRATREFYGGISMIQFPPTKNTILTTPGRNCLPDFLRSTGSISPASDIQRNPSIAAGNASRSKNPGRVSSGISFFGTGSIELYLS
jgi:hypothetical protein